jgi:hypothetical protein
MEPISLKAFVRMMIEADDPVHDEGLGFTGSIWLGLKRKGVHSTGR